MSNSVAGDTYCKNDQNVLYYVLMRQSDAHSRSGYPIVTSVTISIESTLEVVMSKDGHSSDVKGSWLEDVIASVSATVLLLAAIGIVHATFAAEEDSILGFYVVVFCFSLYSILALHRIRSNT